MRLISFYLVLIFAICRATSAIPKKPPVRQAIPADKQIANVFNTPTRLGPVPNEQQHIIGKLTSSLPSQHHHTTEKHATAPVPPQGPVPVTHSTTNSASAHTQSTIDTSEAAKHHTHVNVVGPVSANPADSAATTASSHGTDTIAAAALGADACDAGGDCASLGEALVSAAEGPECRALHVTGKCSAKCLAALKEALAHKLWNACAAKCEIDVVTGAAHRWAELCESRQPTLLDASKEALTIVAAAPGAGRFVQLVVLFGVMVTALALGYRRGLLQSIPLRLQKRLKRRSSERSLV